MYTQNNKTILKCKKAIFNNISNTSCMCHWISTVMSVHNYNNNIHEIIINKFLLHFQLSS